MTPTEVALAYLDSFSTGKPDSIVAWVTDDFVNDQMGALGNRFTGRALYHERLGAFLGRFRGLRYDPGRPIADGVRIAIPYVMHASDDGRMLALDGIMLISVRDGLVCARADYWDGLSYFQQMGIAFPGSPPPAEGDLS